MRSNYIARLKDGRMASIFFDGKGIGCRIWENGRWQKRSPLLEKAQPCFTLNLTADGIFRIFSQDELGGVVLIMFDGDNVSSRTILENKSKDIHTILFYSMESGSSMSLIYNIPAEEGKYKLIMQNLHENGKWDKPEEITRFLPISGGIYNFIRTGPSHGLAFYRSESGIMGYREIIPGKASDFVPLQKYAENMQSYSFLAAGQGLHALSASSNLFSSRLVYKRKMGEDFDPPILLWEGQWLDSSMISEIDGALYAFFHAGGNLYMSKSADNGASFSKAEVYRHKFCRSPIKAGYISAKGQEGYTLNEIYIDEACPWDIQILPDMYDEFYDFSEPLQVSETPPSEPVFEETEQVSLMKEHMGRLSLENADFKKQIAELKKTISSTETEEKRANEMDSVLNARDKHIDGLGFHIEELAAEIKKHKNTINKQSRRIKTLEKENRRLKAADEQTPRERQTSESSETKKAQEQTI